MVLLGCVLTKAQSASSDGVDLRARVQLSKSGHRLKDASHLVVWLTSLANTPPTSMRPQRPYQIPKLIQKDKSFQPSLLVIPAGGKVEFPNHDPFFHNVFSLFDGKRFDLGLYEGGTTRFVQFDKPGISFIFCNIHAQMSAVIVALNTTYYGVSDRNGEIAIHHVAPGRYQLHLFHPSVSPDGLQSAEREITVAPNRSSLGSFDFAESEIDPSHKNKYGRDYDRPDPDNPAYARP